MCGTAAGCSWVAAADHEGEHGLESVGWPWSHEGMLDSFDHGAIRRGFQVYQQVRLRSSTHDVGVCLHCHVCCLYTPCLHCHTCITLMPAPSLL